MKIFMTGAAGYIGGSVAALLQAAGHQVRGLVRDAEKASRLANSGIEPVIGDLDDSEVLRREALHADGVINTANADHLASVLVLLDALEGSEKPFIHTSGSSVVGDDARGNYSSDVVVDERGPFVVMAAKLARHRLNTTVIEAGARRIRSVVVCPSLIYGVGKGLKSDSIQMPFLARQAMDHGRVRLVGQGLNIWSTVHVDDLAELYALALDGAPPGAFYFAESGEVSFAAIGDALLKRLSLDEIEHLTPESAAAEWGEAKAFYTLGSNSRVRAERARKELGWNPTGSPALEWLQREMVI